MPASMNTRSYQVLALLALVIVPPLCFEIIFPFINQVSSPTALSYCENADSYVHSQFLLDIGVVEDPADAGFYSGLVDGALAVAHLVTGEERIYTSYYETCPLSTFRQS